MADSTHKVEIVKIDLKPHENAESLSICMVDKYVVVLRTEDWEGIEYGAYVQPDSVVDTTRPEFAFLAKEGDEGKFRVKAVKLRGIKSFGLMVPAPEGSKLGDDVADILGVEHWNPPLPAGSGAVKGPAHMMKSYKYDIEAMKKYHHIFVEGEKVNVTEKIHGANGRFVCIDGEMHCGSRNQWKEEAPGDIWWKCLENYPGIRKACIDNPGYIVYGEVYGQVADLKYGKEGIHFAMFDVMRPNGDFMDFNDVVSAAINYNIPLVPLLETMEFDLDRIIEMAEGPSMIEGAEHHREGVVVKPIHERVNAQFGRAALKVVGQTYLEKS